MKPLPCLQRNLFTAPYRLLPLAVFGFFALCGILHPLSPLRTGLLPDPDDYMRLNEVINWMQGQGWYDLSHPRLAPGENTIVHWSRLVDIPLALIAAPLAPLLGMANAALVASFIVPLALFGLLLLAITRAARIFVGRGRANLAAPLALFAVVTLAKFTPGQADHHAHESVIAALALALLPEILFGKRGWRAGIIAALAFASGLWISAEILPWIAAFIAATGIVGAWRGGTALRNGAIFGLAWPFATTLILPLAVKPNEYFSHTMSWFTGASVMFALLSGAPLILGWLLGRATHNRALRLALVGAAGFFSATLFLNFAADIVSGPYAGYDSFFNATVLPSINEAQPLSAALGLNLYDPARWINAAPFLLRNLWMPCLALNVCGIHLWRAGSPRRRALWLAQALFLLPALLLSLFWQMRVLYFAQLFALVPLAFLLCGWWRKITATLSGRPRFWAEIAAFLIIAPLPVVLIPSATHSTPFFPNVVLFPVTIAEPACNLRGAAEFLASRYADRPRLIMAGAGEGPELLFHTPHSVLAALYDVKANRDVFEFFASRDDSAARDALKRSKADLVLVCRKISYLYARLGSREERRRADLYTDKNGNLRMTGNRAQPTLTERLADGAIPPWLTPVEIPGKTGYLLFEIGVQGSGFGVRGKNSKTESSSPTPEPRTPNPL